MLEYATSLFTINQDNLLTTGQYSTGMVALSILIAVFTSFMAIQVAEHAPEFQSKFRRQASLFSGSLALGGGVWSMHFIGMIAFDLCTPVEYAINTTLVSALPSIAASWVALNIISKPSYNKPLILLGGVIVGAGIGAMHYIGMAAMEMAPLLRYHLPTFLLSILVAVVLAVLALWVGFGLKNRTHLNLSVFQRTAIASAIMGAAIAGMHYTGMSAARFVLPEGIELSSQTSSISTYLAIAVTIATFTITSLIIAINYIIKYKQLSHQAKVNEARMRSMMDTALDSMLILDTFGNVVHINKAVENVFGWTPADLLGKSIVAVLPTKLKQEFAEQINSKTNIFIGKSREVKVLNKAGEQIDVRLAVGKCEVENEIYYIAYVSDLTERLKMESELRFNEERFRSLISNIPGIAFRCLDQSDWAMLYISDAVEEITGYPASDFVLPNPKRSFADLYHPDDSEPLAQMVGSKGGYCAEYRIITKSGDVRWMLEHGNFIEKEHKTTWLDGFIMDITERKDIEKELRQAKEVAEQAAASRSAFLANMSHEIRTPMNAIIGFADILLDSPLQKEQSEQLRTIHNSAKSLLHLLNDVLDSAKLEKGRFDLELVDFSLIEEIDMVVSTLWLEAKKKNIVLNTEISPSIKPYYLGDPHRIRQVLTNLVSNAIKFTPAGQVTVKVSESNNGHIDIVVLDTGIGMTPEQLKVIFDAFTQADASVSRKFGGTGLGTTISKQLVELMGGTIHVNSQLGEGSQFTIHLPLQSAQNKHTKPSKGSYAVLPPLSILVVDDIQQNIDLLTTLLSNRGHKVMTARDGEQALTRLNKASNIDLVLMDIQMPVLDGINAALQRRQLESELQLKKVPIIMLTASTLEQDRVAATAAGVDGFAYKPVDYIQLSQEIARVLQLNLESNNTSNEASKEASNDAFTIQNNEIEGFDCFDANKGIELWGSKRLYMKELNLFYQTHCEKVKHLTYNAETVRSPDAQNYIHSIKGLSGNLALTKLFGLFKQLEENIQNESFLTLNSLYTDIQLQFNQLKQALDLYFSTQNPNNPIKKSLEPNVILKLLEQLSEQVEHNEFDEDILAQLSAAVPTEWEQKVVPLVDTLNEFEFAKAQQIISQLKLNIAEV
ncbi:MHYT domain-containing protein [Catenovulum sediminis]|uniref:histidine kinase n=1 Tax=Catenovulum sediminis TaxID=1740262 RepID=A0ABV1RJG7_9ALTE